MKTKAIILALSLVLLMSLSVIADVPDEITYQGRLLYNGSPVTSATNITFRLYDAESGTLRWTQGPQSVTPDSNGIYTVILGSLGNEIPDDYDELWLELVVAGNPLTPRKKLTSAPFVLRTGELPNLKLNDDNTNIFIGSGPDIPGASITTGNHNVAIGEGSLVDNTAGRYNVALGSYALQHHDHNGDSYNIGVGFGALATGGYTRNIGIGAYALSSAQTTASGAFSNIAIGYMAGGNITTGDNNIIIGNNIDAPSATANNQLNIGDAIYGNLSNGNVGIGTSSPSTTAGFGGPILEIEGTEPVLKLDGDNDWEIAIRDSNRGLGFWKDGSQYVTIDASGNVGIGAASPGYKFTVDENRNNWAVSIKNTHSTDGFGVEIYAGDSASEFPLALYNAVGNPKFYFKADGDAQCAGGVDCWGQISDITYKSNIADLELGLNEVMQLQPRRYDFELTGESDFGLIAQEVEPVIPELVSGGDGNKSVGTSGFTPILINAIQELKAENDQLKAVVCEIKPEADICN